MDTESIIQILINMVLGRTRKPASFPPSITRFLISVIALVFTVQQFLSHVVYALSAMVPSGYYSSPSPHYT